MLLKNLCSTLSALADWPGLLSTEYGMREERNANPDYEVPEVREVETCSPLVPSLLLITASAAVGKSTAAAYMAHELRAPILDLSTLHVGDGTLEGALAKSLGIRKNAEFSEALTQGSATLIIDALDEAEVRSGQANFHAFIRGVADTASQMTGGAAIVLFSRAESARPLQALFSERGLPYSHFEIQSFSKDQAERYLSRRMEDVYRAYRKEAIHHKHARPFESARDNLFATLASAISQDKDSSIWANRDARDFLGYAPVLDVAAEYLAVDNFATLEGVLGKSQDGGFAHWDLVANVIDQLLLREQDKFVQQFKKTSVFRQHGSAQVESVLYSPEEQCARLLDYVENFFLDLQVPVVLPSGLREPYESAANAQLANHPFLRGEGWFNVIFRDYVTARCLASPVTSAKASQAVRKNILSSEWKHSPMYGFFSYSLGKPSGDSSSSCHSEEIGALYESFKSMCEAEDQLAVTVGRKGNRLIAVFAISRAKTNEMIGPLKFLSHEGTKSVCFSRELSRANIWDVPDVILGGDHRSFKFGANVYISCGDLMMSSSELQVYVEKDSLPALINAKSLTSDSVKIQSDVTQLMILCDEDLGFPWSKYQRHLDVGSLTSDARESEALYLEFRRIVLRFKDAKQGEGAVYQPMMDNLVVGTNKRARTVLDYLQEIGCVKLANSMYLLDFAEFAKLGISRPQLRDLEENEAAARISAEILHFSKKV